MNTNNLPQTDELAAYDPAQLFDHALIACTLFHYTAIESHPGLVHNSVTYRREAPPDYSRTPEYTIAAIRAFNKAYNTDLAVAANAWDAQARARVIRTIAQCIRDYVRGRDARP